MGIFEALILGVVQGLTEFLPVSSSGHIEIVKELLNVSTKQQNLLMTVVLHAATALSTLVIFRKDIVVIFAGLFQCKWNEEAKFSVKIILSMLPAAFVGLFFENEIESLFGGKIILVGSMLILTGLLLFLADKAKKNNETSKHVQFCSYRNSASYSYTSWNIKIRGYYFDFRFIRGRPRKSCKVFFSNGCSFNLRKND